MPTQYIINLEQSKTSHNIGLKADKLHFLLNKGFRIPNTFVCVWDAKLTCQPVDTQIREDLKIQLKELLSHSTSYAVRSSANLEDGHEHSFAGQFLTKLDVRGTDEVMQALVDVQASLHAESVQSYLSKQNIPPSDIKMAVIIQEMIQPVVSGVAFSKNPITGMDEVVVEAVTGSGKDLVRGIITPFRWVYKWGDWLEKPKAEEIPNDLIAEVVSQTTSIAHAYGEPVDLEWVYDGSRLYWLQVREITALKDINVYSNNISKEFMPGIIKPLVWSVDVPLVNGAWVRVLKELIGNIEIDPMRLAKSFYYRAYFNMGVMGEILQSVGLPEESIENLMGIPSHGPDKPKMRPSPKTLRHLPRLLRFAIDKLRYSHRVNAFVSVAEEGYDAISVVEVEDLSDGKLMETISDVFELTQQVAYFNIITTLRMQIFNQVLKRQFSKIGFDYEDLNLTSGWEEQEQFDPNPNLLELSRDYRRYDHEMQERILNSGYGEFISLPGIEDFQSKVELFLERFGHLSDSGNDFSLPLWRESPDMILKLIINYPIDKIPSGSAVHLEDLPIPRSKRGITRWLYRMVRESRFDRERVNYIFGIGMSLFRTLFLEIGTRFDNRGMIARPQDVFYLYLDEIQGALREQQKYAELGGIISHRQAEIEMVREVNPPGIIFGDQVPPVEVTVSSALKGTPTSRGYYRGPVQVVRGLMDVEKVKEGCVLVIPYSDVGLTPFFAKAGAVVSEAGGMLSHSSIVAREFGIPAVVSVPGACSLPDGMQVMVDGYTGELHIYDDPKDSG